MRGENLPENIEEELKGGAIDTGSRTGGKTADLEEASFLGNVDEKEKLEENEGYDKKEVGESPWKRSRKGEDIRGANRAIVGVETLVPLPVAALLEGVLIAVPAVVAAIVAVMLPVLSTSLDGADPVVVGICCCISIVLQKHYTQ